MTLICPVMRRGPRRKILGLLAQQQRARAVDGGSGIAASSTENATADSSDASAVKLTPPMLESQLAKRHCIQGDNAANGDPADPQRDQDCTRADASLKSSHSESLWELASLKRHICPLVARAVSMLEADVTRRDRVTQDVPVADFARASYRSMLDEEAGRKLKSVPVAFYKARPTSVFALGLVAGGGLGVEGGEEKDAPAEVEVAEGQRADARDDAFEGWSFA